jgi:hypoxanthine phosphoribosyltransferase
MNNHKVKLHDKYFAPFISAEKIDKVVSTIAKRMELELAEKNPLFIIVLNGAFMFASDLLKKIDFDCEITFVKLSSYIGTKSAHLVRELIGLDKSITNRNVVIIEDIIDTGITMHNTLPKLKNMEAASVQIATLLFKPDAFQKNFQIDYIGLEIPNDFIVGYGLDYDGLGRNLPGIYKIIE